MKKLTALMLAILILMLPACSEEDTSSKETTAKSTESIESTEIQTTEKIPEEPPVDTSYLKYYKDAVADFKTLIEHRFSGNWDPSAPMPEFSDSLKDLIDIDLVNIMLMDITYGNEDESSFGYILHDLNGDRIPELFWVDHSYTIHAMFTYHNDAIKLLKMCYSRSSAGLAGNGQLSSHGSSGAFDTTTSVDILSNGELNSIFVIGCESIHSTYEMRVRFFESSDAESIDYTNQEDILYDRSPKSDFVDSLKIFPLDHVPTAEDTSLPADSDIKYLPYSIELSSKTNLKAGPGYVYSDAGAVVAGTYTIVAEILDNDGNMWGLLESDDGWLMLAESKNHKVDAPAETTPPVATTTAATTQPVVEPNLMTAELTTEVTLASGNYHRYDPNEGLGMVVSFYALDRLTNVVLSFGPSYPYPNNEFTEEFRLDELTPDKPLVANILLNGPGVIYKISFTTPTGKFQEYLISESTMVKEGISPLSFYRTNN